jgi:hypothetical protein
MRLLFTFLLLSTATLLSLAQSQTDQEAVLKLCIDLPEIQNLLPTDAHGDPQAVRIMQHAVYFDTNLSLAKFGRDVEFLSKDQIFSLQSDAFLRFDKFKVDFLTAEVAFDVDYNRNDLSNPKRVHVNLLLGKSGTEWIIEEFNFEWR